MSVKSATAARRRVASAVGDGATAVRLVQEYLCVTDVAEADRNL